MMTDTLQQALSDKERSLLDAIIDRNLVNSAHVAGVSAERIAQRVAERRAGEHLGLIIDVGASDGGDTAYYLAKGFRVVSVEADPTTVLGLRERFKTELASGALTLVPCAASNKAWDTIEFHAHAEHQGVSGIMLREEVDQSKYTKHAVPTVDWVLLKALYGIPRYLKIDIEGSEAPFLRGLLEETELPTFVSVESYQIEPAELLHLAGYGRFNFVDQNPSGGWSLPKNQREGRLLESFEFKHSSGPFGLDVFNDEMWMDFATLRRVWEESIPLTAKTWFDVHAWRP